MDNLTPAVTDPTSVKGATQDPASAAKVTEPSPEKQGTQEVPTLTKAQHEKILSDKQAPLGRELKAAKDRITELEKSLTDKRTAEAASASAKLDSDEEAALKEAGEDEQKRQQVKSHFAELRQGRGLLTENTQLKEQLKLHTKVEELLELLNVETPEQLVSLLEGANVYGQANVAKKLSEKYKVSENLIKPLFKFASTPEELDELVKDISDNLTAGANLPNPANPSKPAGGEKTQDQRDREMYPTMFK